MMFRLFLDVFGVLVIESLLHGLNVCWGLFTSLQ